MNITKIFALGFTLMFAVLCFSRPEAVVVKYNYSMGKVTHENFGESGISSMSDDGLLAAVNTGLMTAEDAKGESQYSHYQHVTDNMNLSTLLLESK